MSPPTRSPTPVLRLVGRRLRDAFDRESMLAFDEVMRSKIERGRKFDVFGNPTDQPDALWLPSHHPEMVEPVRAPRLRQILPGALTPSERPAKVQMFEAAWLVDDGTDPGNWHKDYPHYDGMDLDSYQAPEAICAPSQLF